MKVNDFGMKYKSYAEAIIGKKSEEKIKKNDNDQLNQKKVLTQNLITNNNMLLQMIIIMIQYSYRCFHESNPTVPKFFCRIHNGIYCVVIIHTNYFNPER